MALLRLPGGIRWRNLQKSLKISISWLKIFWMPSKKTFTIKPLNTEPKIQRKLIHTTNSKSCLIQKGDSFLLTGMVQPKQRLKSKKRPKRPFDVSLSMHQMKRVYVWLQENLHIEG